MKKTFTKCVVFLGFVFFFAMFSVGFGPATASAKDISTESPKQETPVPETQAEIKLRVKTKALVKDTKYTLKVYNLSENQKAIFKSSDPEVVTVNEKGVIRGISNGIALVTATIKEGPKTVTVLNCVVTVGPPAFNVKWTRSTVIIPVGKRSTLKTILLPFNTAESAKFFSADTDIVTISSTGKITAKSIGSTYVFTSINNGRFDFCRVLVVDEYTYNQLLDDPALLVDFDTKPADADTDADTDEELETKPTDTENETESEEEPDFPSSAKTGM